MLNIEDLQKLKNNGEILNDIKIKVEGILPILAHYEVEITMLKNKIQRIEHLLLSNNIK